MVKEAGEYSDKKDAEKALESVLSAIKKALVENQSVELTGFGKFENALQKGKEGKVPGTDRTYKTTDKFIPKFKPGKTLREEVAKIKP